MCDREDNVTGWLPEDWRDPVDNVLMDKVYPVLLKRHRNCIPSNACLIDSITRYLGSTDDQVGRL